MTLSAAEANQVKQAPTSDSVLAVVRHRWSPRSFADRDVSNQDLKTIFEAAHWAASSYNEQPWRFFMGRRGSETHSKIFESLVGFNQAWARTAPVLILGAAATRFSHNGSDNVVALFDLGAASITLCYQATALGIFTHQMAGFDRDKARELFHLPSDFVWGSAIALGYQGEPSALSNDHLLEQETAPRQRKPLSELVLAAWGEPAKLE